jgi:phosphatidylserine decarboxylase
MLTFVEVLLAVFIAFLGWRFWWFFRNPKRSITTNDRQVLSAADGLVIYAKKVTNDSKEPILSVKNRKVIRLNELMHIDDDRLLNKSGWLIGVFMTPFNVHYNRAPIRGQMRKIKHDYPTPERTNFGMFNGVSNIFFNEAPYHHDCDYVIHNERASYVISNEKHSVYVTQIADKTVNRCICFKDRSGVAQGEVFGLIRMGSQVDIFVPDSEKYELKVKERQKVKAGLTVLLERKED